MRGTNVLLLYIYLLPIKREHKSMMRKEFQEIGLIINKGGNTFFYPSYFCRTREQRVIAAIQLFIISETK